MKYPERVLALGFVLLILAGALLLALPPAARNGRSIGWQNALFTSTSAVCVTGLVAVDTGLTFSPFGQAVLLVLIQVGGLGFMLFATLIMVILGRNISLKERMLIRDSVNTSSLSGLLTLVRRYALLALGIELGGAALLALRFVPAFGPARGLWYALFHAVSAFCNAGFDLFGHFTSLTGFARDPLVLLTVAALVILGGLGFAVILEMAERKRWLRVTLHTRVVLIASGALLLGGTLFYLAAEFRNPGTLARAGATGGSRLLDAFFQSVTMRTAGFNSIDLAELKDGSKLFSSVLMLIGASPASTGGGMKTTTVAAVMLLVGSTVRGSRDISVSGRRLAQEVAHQALAVIAVTLLVWLAGTVAIALVENERHSLIDLLFETSSALATVGVSAIGTPQLSAAGRFILIPMMYVGRVGALTLVMALTRRQGHVQNRIRYPEEKMMIG